MTKRAFTLIELLVVIAIIGILSAVVLVGMQEAQARSRFTQVSAQMREIAKAMDMHALTYGDYPENTGTNVKPNTDMITQWPTPPCPGWVYDWDGPPAHVGDGMYIKIIRTGVSGAIPGLQWYMQNHQNRSHDIRNNTSKKITCAE